MFLRGTIYRGRARSRELERENMLHKVEVGTDTMIGIRAHFSTCRTFVSLLMKLILVSVTSVLLPLLRHAMEKERKDKLEGIDSSPDL